MPLLVTHRVTRVRSKSREIEVDAKFKHGSQRRRHHCPRSTRALNNQNARSKFLFR